MKWFKKVVRRSAEKTVGAFEMPELKQQLNEVKNRLATSFAELETIVAETTSKAVELNNRLAKNDERAGVVFISRTGKLLFANKAAFHILRLKHTKNRRVIKLYKQDGAFQTVTGLANAVFDGTSDGCFDIDVTTNNFLFKEPVVIEFDGEELTRPVVLRVALADAQPQAPSDVIFICHLHSAQTDELAEPFKNTTATGDLEL